MNQNIRCRDMAGIDEFVAIIPLLFHPAYTLKSALQGQCLTFEGGTPFMAEFCDLQTITSWIGATPALVKDHPSIDQRFPRGY